MERARYGAGKKGTEAGERGPEGDKKERKKR